MYRLLIILLALLPILDLWSIFFFGNNQLLVYGLAVGVAVGGGLLAWIQWQRLWKRYQTDIAPSPMPPSMILHGVLIFGATVIFITPGFCTDLLAVLFLFPPTRAVIVFLITQQHFLFQAARFQKKYQKQQQKNRSKQSERPSSSQQDDIIDVDFDKK